MDKKVLITGASRGLGLYFTKKYLEEGACVFAGVRDVQAPFIRELKEIYPDTLIPLLLEVEDSASVNKAAAEITTLTDHLDIIINNAAIHNETSFDVLENADIDDCLRVYDVNSLGPLRVVKAFLALIRKGKKAMIINISSESGSIGSCWREKEFDYCMSKAALNMAAKLLSNYLKKDEVKVLAVHPGWMRTDMGGSNAELDPYETACKLVQLFEEVSGKDCPVFIDNNGNQYPW